MVWKSKKAYCILIIFFSALNFLFADRFNTFTDINNLKGNPVYIEVERCSASQYFDSVKEGEYFKLEDLLFDEKGNLIERIEYDENKPFTYTMTGYDDLQRVKKRTFDSVSGIKNYEYFYKDDSKYNLKRVVTDSKNELINTDEFKCKKEGSNLVIWFYKYDSEENILEAGKEVYTENENPLEITSYDKNGEIENFSKFIYENDKKTYLSYTSDGELNYSEETFYNEKKLEIRCISKWTGSLDFLSGTNEYKYEYDDYGNWIKKTVFEGKEKFGKTVFEPSHIIKRKLYYINKDNNIPTTIRPVISKIKKKTNDENETIELESYCHVWEEVDPFDDVKTVYFSISADKENSTDSNVSLIIRAKPDETEIYIRWDEYLGTEAYVKSRVDNGMVDESEWNISTSNEATFYPYDNVELVKTFLKSEKYVAKITPYNESPVTAFFSLKEFVSKAEKYRKYLNW